MSREISVEEALDTLMKGEGEPEPIGEESDQNLPDIQFAVEHDDGRPWYKEILGKSRYKKWEIDEHISEFRIAIDSWANDNGYEILNEEAEAFDRPIDEQLVANMKGEIKFEGGKIDYSIYGGREGTRSPVTEIRHTDGPGYSIFVNFEGFDGSMTEEYRELYALSETILPKFGDIKRKKPDFMKR